MIAANVAAARALEARKSPIMYRVHEPPSREKLEALKDYLETFGIEFTLGQVIKPATFNRIIERVGASDSRPEIMEQLLRTQMQARYAPDRLGHFGLALGTYAHFTSPIRRYADLFVHRALVSAFRLGDGGLPPADAEKFEEIGEQISGLERRAMQAERETVDRYVAAYLSDQRGQVLLCRITGVQPFGFFATVVDFGGDGLVPVSTIGDEYFRYDEKAQQLVGEESGTTYRQGQKLRLRIAEADPVSGSLRFALPDQQADGAVRRPNAAIVYERPAGAAGRQTFGTAVAAPLIFVATFRRGAYWVGKGERPWPTGSQSSSAAFARQPQPKGCALDLRDPRRQSRLLDDRDRRSAALQPGSRRDRARAMDPAFVIRFARSMGCCSSARNIIAAFRACSRMRSTSARGPMARACSTRSRRRSSLRRRGPSAALVPTTRSVRRACSSTCP